MPTAYERLLILRADANARIGNGHLMRSFALAQTWRSLGGRPILVGIVRKEVPSVQRHGGPEGVAGPGPPRFLGGGNERRHIRFDLRLPSELTPAAAPDGCGGELAASAAPRPGEEQA